MSERKFTPEFKLELEKHGIFVATNSSELWEKTRDNDVTDINSASSRLELLLYIWKGDRTQWSALEGLNVLDLASGSIYSGDCFGGWDPNFSRLCAVNNANVLALDINNQSKIDSLLFRWEAVDIVSTVLDQGLNSINSIKGKTFDIINSSNFVGMNYCPEIPKTLHYHKISLAKFENELLRQSGELLAEGGILTIDTADDKFDRIYYTKKLGVVSKIPKTAYF